MRLWSLLAVLCTSCFVLNSADDAPSESQLQEDTSDTSVTAEGAPSTFVNNVNTIFGNFLLPTVDLVVPGPVPLHLVRYYNSENTQSKWLHGYGMSTNFPLWIRGSYPNERVHCSIAYAADFGEAPPLYGTPYIPDELAQTRFPGIDEDEDNYDEFDEEEEEDDDDDSPPVYTNNVKNREFSDTEKHRFDSEKLSQLLNIGADFSKLKMGSSVKEKTDSSRYLGIEQVRQVKDEKHDKGDEDKFAYAYVEEVGGSVLCTSAEPRLQDMEFYLDPKTIHKGLTNVGSGEISARTNFKNTKVNYHRKKGYSSHQQHVHWSMTLSNGGKRFYKKGYGFNTDKVLKEEITTSGNKLHFKCGSVKKWGFPLKEIRATDLFEKRTFGTLKVEYEKKSEKHKKVTVKGSNGKSVTYYYERHSVNDDDVPFITKIVSSDQPDTEYSYDRYDNGKKYLLSKISHPNGRYIELEYDDKGRVINQKGPVGKDGAKRTIFEFHYHPKEYYTSVTDANDNKRKYYYSSKKRLKSIERFDSEKKLLREDKFFWGEKEGLKRGKHDNGDEGHLLGKAVLDERGAVSCTRFEYDAYGNIIKKKFFGDITGTDKGHFSLTDEGHPRGEVECYQTFASYNDDAFHMCCEESEECGPTVLLFYKEGTNLLEKKLIKENDQVRVRETYEYDDDAVLVKKTRDDGCSHRRANMAGVTERHSTYITPVRGKQDHGVGQPQEVRECYVDQGQEILLKRTTYEYTKGGDVSKETHFDANNTEAYHIRFSYDDKGRLLQKAHSAGKKYIFDYDSNGNKTREELLRSGMHTKYVYDKANRLISEIECHDNGLTLTTQYTYDIAGNKTSMTDRFGQVTKYEYDGLGRVKTVMYPAMLNRAGSITIPHESFEYDVCGRKTTVTDKEGCITRYKYTAWGKPKIITYPDGSQEKFVYNKKGLLLHKTDRNGTTTQFEYDLFGRVIKTIVNGTKTTQHTYSSFHKTSMCDPMGNITLYRYDGASRILEEEKNGKIIRYAYDELGRKCSEKAFTIDGGYNETLTFYDLFDRVIEETVQHSDGTLLSKVKYAYDLLDNRIAVITYASKDITHTERTSYNSMNLPTKYTDALGNSTCYSYDFEWKNEIGQNCRKKTTIDPLLNKTIEIEDAYGRLDTIEKRSEKNSLLAKTTFRYDARGNKTAEKQYVYEDGVLIREYLIEWTYTSMGLIATCTEQPGADEKKTEYCYTTGGLLATITKPDGVKIHHTYDGFSRLASIASSDGSIHYTYEYDLNDNVTAVQDSVLGLTHRKTYDGDNRVVTDSLGTGVATQFSYDRLDRVTGLSFSSGQKIEYRYASGSLKDVVRKDASNNELYTHRYEDFDLRGNVVRSSMISSCGTLFTTWNPRACLEKIFSQHFEENVAKFDAVGNLLEITETDPEGKMTYSFAYDNLYQLIEENGIAHASYKCDSINNRVQKDDKRLLVNSLNQLIVDSTQAYSYDKNGNPIKVGSLILMYDALDRLVAIEKPNYARTEYTYDAFHRRIQKKTFSWTQGVWEETQTRRFLFFNKRDVGSIDQTGLSVEFRVLGLGRGAELGASVAIEIEGKTYCPIHDHRGNIAVLLDADTKLPTDTYRYTAFGEEEVFGSTNNPWRFSSKRVDPESGFVFFGRRYYLPITGRFLTPDPTGFSDGPNLYSYVHNSPLMLVDPYGLLTTDAADVAPERSDCPDIGSGSENQGTSISENTSDVAIGTAEGYLCPEQLVLDVLGYGEEKSVPRIVAQVAGTGLFIASVACSGGTSLIAKCVTYSARTTSFFYEAKAASLVGKEIKVISQACKETKVFLESSSKVASVAKTEASLAAREANKVAQVSKANVAVKGAEESCVKEISKGCSSGITSRVSNSKLLTGPDNITTKTLARNSLGRDGCSSVNKIIYQDGRPIGRLHQVFNTEGKIVHQHLSSIGESGIERIFSSELTGIPIIK